MISIKLNSLVNIMEFCDVHTLYQMKFINSRNYRYSILKSHYLKLIQNLTDEINFSDNENILIQYLQKNNINEITQIKIAISYIISKKLKISKELIVKERNFEKLNITNFYGEYFSIKYFT